MKKSVLIIPLIVLILFPIILAQSIDVPIKKMTAAEKEAEEGAEVAAGHCLHLIPESAVNL